MAPFLLFAALATLFTLQYRHDVKSILGVVADRRWSDARVRWTPHMLGSRGDRHYWLRYLDEQGRMVRRLCRVSGVFAGSAGVFLQPEKEPLTGVARFLVGSRLASIVVFAFAGGMVGLTLGIGACLLLFHGSNIAPAYGVILGGPLGLGAGAWFGATRER